MSQQPLDTVFQEWHDNQALAEQMIPLIVYASGEVQELQARDCHHPQYSLAGIAQAAEIATIQGDTGLWLLTVGGETVEGADHTIADDLQIQAVSVTAAVKIQA